VRLKVLSYNIRFGGLGRENLLAEVIRSVSADIVIFQEAIIPDVIERIASETNLPYWVSETNHSVGYCSRIEIARHEWHVPAGSRHRFLEIQPKACDTPIFGVHLRAMMSKWGEERRTIEIQRLLAAIQKYENGFHVLAGDFNSLGPGEMLHTKKMPYWIRTMIWLSGRNIQRATVQHLLDYGYADGFRALHKDGTGYTFPTKDPHLRFDYVFVPARFVNQLISCQVVQQPPAPAASDHFPLLAEIEI
jgi:endonuclease/exonuclease/phosphatase family metal-dependent hydrolase